MFREGDTDQCAICPDGWNVIVPTERGQVQVCEDCYETHFRDRRTEREAEFRAYEEMDWGTPLDYEAYIAYE